MEAWEGELGGNERTLGVVLTSADPDGNSNPSKSEYRLPGTEKVVWVVLDGAYETSGTAGS